MKSSSGTRFRQAVAELAPAVQARVCERHAIRSEESLWYEMTCCILSSQVPYSLALAAAQQLRAAAIFGDGQYTDQRLVESRVLGVLTTPLEVDDRFRLYRFPRVRAAQIGGAWSAVRRCGTSLSDLVNSTKDAENLRGQLVNRVPGLGPKQASMFLRNVGVTYDLAILDRHVLKYMWVAGLSTAHPCAISSLTSYCRYEATLRIYADQLGYPVGIVDWAIWIVMRAAATLERK
jgi:N-glycosylase/DNA lyase